MKILIPILGFAPQGGYRVLSELANAWIRHGHECTFLVPATSSDPYFPTAADVVRCDWLGRFVQERSSRRSTGHDNIVSVWSGLKRVARNYDVILANHSLTAWPVRWSSAGNAKKFYYIQAYEPSYYKIVRDPVKKIMAQLSYFFDLKQVSNSKFYTGPGLSPIDVIPPGIDLSVFQPKDALPDFGKDAKIVLGTIGRREPYKGTLIALAAYRKLKREFPNLQMSVGFGNIEPADDVTIVDIHGDQELASYYRSVDILIVSCRGQHGAPHYPLIEAMASGTPVVHTGYYPGTEENSWEAKDTSVHAIVEAIRQVIAEPSSVRQKKTAMARCNVVENLAWDEIAERFLRHFDV